MQQSSRYKKSSAGPTTSFRSGLNKTTPPRFIDPEELVDATNWFYDPKTGYITTRPGLRLLKAGAIPSGFTGIYPFEADGILMILASCDDGNLYVLDVNYAGTSAGALTGSARTSFATMAKKAAICSGGVLQTYDTVNGLKPTTSPPMNFIIGQSTNVSTTTYARIWGCGDPAHRERINASAAGDPAGWNFADITEMGPKYFDAGFGDGQDATGILPYMGDLFITKRSTDGSAKSIHRAQVADLNQNWACNPLSRFHGSLSPHLMKELNNQGWMLDADGPKALSVITNYPSSIPFDVRASSVKIAGEIAAFADSTGFSIHDPIFQILMIKPKFNSDTFYCYDYAHDRWTTFRFAVDIQAGALVNGQMLFGDKDGNLYTYDYSSDTDNGARYTMSVETKQFDFFSMDETDVKERFLDILGQTEGALSITYKNQGNILFTKPFTFGSSWWTWDKVNSIMPSDWTENLNKSIVNTVRDDNELNGDFVSFQIIVTSGLCALAQIRARVVATGKK